MTRTLQMNGMTLAMYLLRTNQIKKAPKTVSFKQLKAVSDYCDSILLMHEYMGEIYTINDIKELYIDLDEFKKILKEAK
jgi:hypothetical protein